MPNDHDDELEPLSLPPGGDPDPGHLLPPEDWQRVVEEAERERERIARGDPPGFGQPPAGRFATGALPVSGAVSSPSNGGRRPGGPTFAVLHSAETPLRAGYAASIARYFAGGPGTSCHYMADPAETWGVLDDALIAWHCGTGNTRSIGVEQAGYASLTRAQWLSAEGRAQLGRVAVIMRALRDRYRIAPRFMSDAELLAAHRGQLGGWATHDQCRRVLGGTTHTDPMPNYPLDELVRVATAGAPAPAPTDEGDDMAAARLIRNAKGTVVELAPTYAEWVPTSADHRAAIAQLGPHQTYSDDFFGRLIARARAAGTPPPAPVAARLGAALLEAGADPDDPSSWPATPGAEDE